MDDERVPRRKSRFAKSQERRNGCQRCELREHERRRTAGTIENAQQALQRLRAKRARRTLKEARRMAAEVGFEVSFSKVGKRGGGTLKPRSPRGKVLPKYRNPQNPEETWTGRGRQPKWVETALAGGQTLSELAIPTAVSG